MGHQIHAQHLGGQLSGFVGRLGNLDAAALAAASGVNLRLDDNAGCAVVEQCPSRIESVFAVLNHLPARHGNAVLGQDGLSLVLVNFHIYVVTAGELTRCSGWTGRIPNSLEGWHNK